MDATVWIAIWAFSFLASHLIISSSAVRARLISAVGDQAYSGIYSLVAAGTLGPLIYEFARNKHAGPILWYLRAVAPIRWLAWILMLAALILFVGSFINPNPGGMQAAGGDSSEPRGILKITRHPSFVAFSLFGIAHILMNGWAGDVIFFGMFPALGIRTSARFVSSASAIAHSSRRRRSCRSRRWSVDASDGPAPTCRGPRSAQALC